MFRSPQGSTGSLCCQTVESSCDEGQEERRFDSRSSSWCVRCDWEGPSLSRLTLRVHYGYAELIRWYYITLHYRFLTWPK